MNKKFIDYLSHKLKIAELETIHFDAIPSPNNINLDLTALDWQKEGEEEEKTSYNFLFGQLLDKSKFQFKIDFSKGKGDDLEPLKEQLNALCNQNEDIFLEQGIRTFGLGYPLLVQRSKTDPSRLIKAPLIIWSLDIKRSDSVSNQWIITKNSNTPVHLNEILFSYLNQEEEIRLEENLLHFLDNNLLGKDDLLKIIESVWTQLGTNFSSQNARLETCPLVEDLEQSATEKPQIYWAAILGIYKKQKESIVKDIEQLKANFESFNFDNYAPKMLPQSQNTSVYTDPSQEEILTSLTEKEYTVIQGPPGTGKSQALTAIITNVLENEGKILVVCEKKTALNVIHQNLQKLGLQNLLVVIDDADRDRKNIVAMVRQMADNTKPKQQRFNERNYQAKLKRYDKLIKTFSLRHQNLLKATFRDYNLKEIVTDYLQYKIDSPVDSILFEKVAFELSETEHDYLISYIEEAGELFEDLETESFVFDSLGGRLFANPIYSIKNERAMFERIEQERQFLLSVGIADLPQAKQPFLLEPFAEKTKSEFNFEAFQTMLDKVENALPFWQKRYHLLLKLNQHIEHISIIKENGFFTKVKRFTFFYQKIFTHLKTLQDLYKELRSLQESIAKLPENLILKPLKYSSSTKAMKLFSSKHKAIDEFWKKAPLISQKINKIISKSRFNKIEKDLFEEENQTVPCVDDVVSIVQKLEACLDRRDYFKDYFNWRIFYEAAPLLIQNCLEVLRKVSAPANWDSIFKYNYFYLLIDQESSRLGEWNSSSKMLDKIIEIQSELRRLQKRKILKIWETKKLDTIKGFNRRSNIKWLFNHRKNSKYLHKNSLRNILQEEFDLFTDLFPVVLVNPAVASAILPLKTNLFEVVLFDEASQLKLEDTYPALIRGHKKVIAGDKYQMPPAVDFSGTLGQKNEAITLDFDKTNPLYLAESESLLDFANNLNVNKIKQCFLDFHYRSAAPALIAFSSAAFYGSRLVALPPKRVYKPLELQVVEGIYEDNQINRIEAQAILDFLIQDYNPRKDGIYPSLGIATFTKPQRNFLKDLIYQEILKNTAFRQKMKAIGATEKWFVKSLENVQGDERDIMLLSTTFGRNKEGDFLEDFGKINEAIGYRLLNVIITRAKQKIRVFSSIPSEYYSHYSSHIIQNGNHGKGLLYAYLSYCKAVEIGDEAAVSTILELLADYCNEKELNPIARDKNLLFEAEIYNYLTLYIPEESILIDYQWGDYRLDFVLLDDNQKPSIVIECDGANWHDSPLAYAYDIHRQRILEAEGLKVFRTWTMAWWPNPQKEIERLLEFVNK